MPTGRLFLPVLALLLMAADKSPSPDLARQAEAAFRAGDKEGALKLADAAVQAGEGDPRWLNFRGALRFRLAMIRESIEDFDRAIALQPASEPHHWQRGISYYYAGEFEKGVRQFEKHQTVNSNDVENAVWHYLCLAKWKGIDEARRRLIPIQGDPRVPMMQVHALFAGKATPQDVLGAAKAGKPEPGELHQRLFYAHLYLALYHEAQGESEKSLEHIRQAVERYPAPHYMGDVARVHLKLRIAKP